MDSAIDVSKVDPSWVSQKINAAADVLRNTASRAEYDRKVAAAAAAAATAEFFKIAFL